MKKVLRRNANTARWL